MATPRDSDLPDLTPSVEVDAAPPDEQTPAVPRSVVVSYWILIVSAGLRLAIVVITIASWSKVVDQLMRQPRPAGTSVAQAQSAVHSYLIANLVLDVIFAALYALFAILMRRGRNWARLTITAIVALFAVLGVLNGSDLFTLVSIVIELVAVGLLYTRPAKEFFVAAKAPRPGR